MAESVFHLSVNDVFGTNDAFDDERVALPGTRDLLDDDVVSGVHEIASVHHIRFDNPGDALRQTEDGLRPRQAQFLAKQKLTNQGFDVGLVSAFDSLHRRRTS